MSNARSAENMVEKLNTAHRAVAVLLITIMVSISSMLILLVISIFYEIGLSLAFMIQFIVMFLGCTYSTWKLF